MATTYPRYKNLLSQSIDPLFALLIGTSAAALRIKREENEKRLNQTTTSIVSAREWQASKDIEDGQGDVGARDGREENIGGRDRSKEMTFESLRRYDEGGDRGQEGKGQEIGYLDIARIGWERVVRRVKGEVVP